MTARALPARFIAGLAVSAACVYVVSRRVEWSGLQNALTRVDARWLIAGLAASSGAFGVAALRWRRLVDRRAALTPLEAFESLMIGNFTNLVVPTRLGDVIRAVLVARRGRAPVTSLLASVVVERVADVLMLLAIASLLSLVVVFPGPIAVATRMVGAVTAASIILFIAAGDRIAPVAAALLRAVAPAFADRIGPHVDGFVGELRAAGGPRRVLTVVALSAAAWVLWGIAATCSVRAFDLPAPWYAGFFVMIVVNLGGIVPASPGAIGLYHYLAMLALSVWVREPSLALGFAIVSHAAGIAVVVVFGVLSLAHAGVSVRSLSTLTAATASPAS